jgi:O-antigen/teichoic acid export membrane protein
VTALKRIASGSLASWSRIAVTLVSQVALVPVYLSYWPAETYGIWLALQAFYALSTIFGMAHLTFLENEFIRIGNSDLHLLRRTLWSSIPMALLIALAQLAIVLVLVRTGALTRFLIPAGGLESLEADAAWIALAQVACWFAMVTVSSLAVRALSAIGYYARYAWLGLPYAILNAAVPVIVLIKGGSLLNVGLSQVATTFAFYLICLFDAIWVARRHALAYLAPDFSLGLATLHRATYVLLRMFLEMVRQTGFRLLMLPMVGPTRLAEFATQRTVGNTAFQCMNGVYSPLLPELMRYVREKRQHRMEGALSILWLLLVLILCPATVLLQQTMPYIYPWWTRNAFGFDALLLCCLSASVLVNMTSLPAVAICSGGNLVTLQLKIAAVAAGVLFAALVPLTQLFGIRGAALALLLCESSASALYVRECAAWLGGAGLHWPARAFRICLLAVAYTLGATLLIALWPSLQYAWLLIYVAGWSVSAYHLWHATPLEARSYLFDRMKEIRVAIHQTSV